MSVTYNDMRRHLANEAGYDLALNFDTNQSLRIEDWLPEALRLFYDPMVLPGEREKHQWSFLTPTITLTTTADDATVQLPIDFAYLTGPLEFAPGSQVLYPPIQITSVDQIQKWQAYDTSSSRPRFAALRAMRGDPVANVQNELVFYPTPDDAYSLSARARLNPVFPGATTEVPLGGQPHEQTIIQACRAVVERFNHGPGPETQRFTELLKSSISHDRAVYAPQNYGYNGDESDRNVLGRGIHGYDLHECTYGGSTWN